MPAAADDTANLLSPIEDAFYPDPVWAKAPPLTIDESDKNNEWTLIEIKGGVELTKTLLNERPCWLMGRAADQVHIPMQHPSISRCHARIAFDSSGVPWLRDLKSTHGVFVNKKRLPAESIGIDDANDASNKKGSRGVVLYPGDVIQLGASTRLYCLEGPEQYQRGRIRLQPPKPKPQPNQNVQPSPPPSETENTDTTSKDEEDSGISWGISMEDQNNETDEHHHHEEEESLEEAMKRQQALEQGVPEKHRKAYEKIQALKYKLQNVQLESSRIRRKGSDLTQGQENQLKKNDEKEQKLSEQILERERELYDKLNPDNKHHKRHHKRRKRSHHHDAGADDDDDVDDFFDRTKDSTKSTSGDGDDGETEESLETKWKELQDQLQRKQHGVERASQKVVSLQQRYDRLEATGDVDAFFAQNDLNLAKEQYTKLQNQQQSTQKELEETLKLLKIVNPNNKILLEEQQQKKKKEEAKPNDNDNDGSTMMMMMMPPPNMLPPPPVRKQQQQQQQASSSSSSSSSEGENAKIMQPSMMLPPPPKKRPKTSPSPDPAAAALEPTPATTTTTTTGPPPTTAAAGGEEEALKSSSPQPNPPKTSGSGSKGKKVVKGPARGPPMGTLAALKAVSSSSSSSLSSGQDGAANINDGTSSKQQQQQQQQQQQVGRNNNKSETEQQQKSATTTSIDLKKDEWRAPKDQDGSGYTKLNKKFAGRY